MKKWQIALIAFFSFSFLVSVVDGKPAGVILSLIVIIILLLVFRKLNRPEKEQQYKMQLKDTTQKSSPDHVAIDDNSAPSFQKQSISPESSTETSQPRMEGNESVSEAHSLKIETLHITGTSHYMDNILDLASENYLYDYSKKELIENGLEDEKIYQYEFYPSKVELVAEPENQYDSNAIRVLIDDVHVGYVKSGSCTHVKKLLNSGRVTAIDAEIYGGTYKLLWEDEDGEYQIERNDTPIKINVQLTIR